MAQRDEVGRQHRFSAEWFFRKLRNRRSWSFENMGDKTNVRLTQVPIEATDAEIACFAATMAGMDRGWGSGYAILDEMFVELQAEGGSDER